MMGIRIKRAYEEPYPVDGTRILVDPALAARPDEGQGEGRSLAKGRGAKH